MMNTTKTRKGKWRFFILIPALCFVFLSLSLTNTAPQGNTPEPLNSSSEWYQDPVEVKLITLPEDFRIDPGEAILVLINKVSDVAIDGKLAPQGERVSTIVKKYSELREERFFKNKSPQVKIIVQKDRKTADNDFKNLLNDISKAIYTLQEESSVKIFGKSFKDLGKEEQIRILELYPPEIYQALPKQINPPPKK